MIVTGWMSTGKRGQIVPLKVVFPAGKGENPQFYLKACQRLSFLLLK
jgi:hypothetical protein